MKKYQIREYKDGEWDIIYNGNNSYTYGSPDTFDSRLDAIAMAKHLEKTESNPTEESLGDWLVIDRD
jgi:hypothetical protein